MMDNFECIYRILRTLEKGLDSADVGIDEINADKFGISRNRWLHYIEMMLDMELIKGVAVRRYTDGTKSLAGNNIQITLKGLEYLSENSVMQKIYKTVKDIADIVP